MNTYQSSFQQPYRFQGSFQPAYQQPVYAQPQTFAPSPQPYQQDGTIPARFVSGREEAVASNVLPGLPFVFYDRAHGVVYVKAIDPATGAAEFRTFTEETQSAPETKQTPAYVTLEAFCAYQAQIEKQLAAIKSTERKDVDLNV